MLNVLSLSQTFINDYKKLLIIVDNIFVTVLSKSIILNKAEGHWTFISINVNIIRYY